MILCSKVLKLKLCARTTDRQAAKAWTKPVPCVFRYFSSTCLGKLVHVSMLMYIWHECMHACIPYADVHVFVWHTPSVCQSHPSFCLPHTLVLRNTRLISNSFLDPLHSNYQRRVRGKVSTWEHAAHSPFWCTLEYFKSRGETISSWHIINYTCCSFPLGRSADTLENKSPDVVLNQKDTAWEVGMPWKLVQMAFLNVGV